MADLPEPLTPSDCDLRGMPYMPLDIVRLFDSDFYALSTGEEFKAGLTLWGRAFLQVPAGSLPDDDRILAHLSGAGTRWGRVRDIALRGWFKCTDGRLYHRTVAEKAAEAWLARIARRARTEAARAARGNSVTEPPTGAATKPVTRGPTISVTENVTGSKGREGKGTEGKTRKNLSVASQPPATGVAADEFDQFWAVYPNKKDKGHARKAFIQARRKTSLEAMIAAIGRQDYWTREKDKQPYPATWLHGERWTDQAGDMFDPVLRAAGLSPEDYDEAPDPMRGRLN